MLDLPSDLGLTVIDDLPEMIGWLGERRRLFDFFESNLVFFWNFFSFSR
jgi:hypothetical protein